MCLRHKAVGQLSLGLLIAALLVPLSALPAPPQPDDATLDRCRERLAYYVSRGYGRGDVVLRMRSWFGYEFEAVLEQLVSGQFDLYLIRRDDYGVMTYRALVGSFN